MLSLYRRHKDDCKYADDRMSKKCRCAIWATGTLEGQPYRKSLKTRSWERGEQLKRKIEDGSQPKEKQKGITIKDALEAFIRECESRSLNNSTLGKYRRLSKLLAESLGSATDLRNVDSDRLRGFRNDWNLAPRTAAKQIERLRAFFNFCVENDWITKSPAKAIKTPEIKPSPTLPFSDTEVSKLLNASDFRTQVFFRVLLHSGLRIIDAAALRPEKIIDGKLFLYQQKTGTPVFVPLPPDLLSDLSKLPLTGGFYFAVTSGNPVSIAEHYRVNLTKAAIKAELATKRKKGEPRRKNTIHPHRWRDTFAVRLLEKGVPLETVSILLGHTDLKTTQRSYSPWIKSLQDNLERAVAKTWEKPKLVRMK